MANKTILVCGHGPGISESVARRFGAAGYSVALVARNGERVAAAAKALGASGIAAAGIGADLSNPANAKALVAEVREKLGPIAIIHWNAFSGGAGDLLTADVAELRTVLDLGVTSLVATVQAALPDLKAQKGAVLITGGGLSMYDTKVDAMAVSWNAMGLGVMKAAQHKLGGLLAEKLRPEGVFVGEVTVLGAVKGTAFDQGQATIEAAAVAEKFWALLGARSAHIDHIG